MILLRNIDRKYIRDYRLPTNFARIKLAVKSRIKGKIEKNQSKSMEKLMRKSERN